MSIASTFGLKRPYPFDGERRRRVLTELARRGMSITELAYAIGASQSNVSEVINGRRLQESLEKRIADYLHVNCDYLFPRRTVRELLELQKQEKEKAA
ncbi:MAG: helix-turn-helix domain-containing protein [Treponema lecithinolyticum]|uniref:helix-turn-helix domain-containing protein n=1 Tax=Treponema lecithinolyticum TaxID=53418 RepID=UPI0036151A3D